MFAKEALEEIRQWRQRTGASQHQLDWRWAERFRDLSAQSSTWGLTWAGPFTEEEQREWDRLFVLPFDEAVKAALERLMKNSRERELETAIREQREPRLRYPALPIEEIQREFDGLQQLGEDVRQHEPNAIVRRLYQDVIEEELDYLCLLKATLNGNRSLRTFCFGR